MNSYGDSFTLVQAPLVDGYGGSRVRDWPNATRKVYAGSVQAQSGREDESGRQVTTTDKNLWCAPSVPITAVDRVEWNGGTYRVDGKPEVHYQQGMPDHVEAVLVETEEQAT